jgi:hypothetical protein
MKKITKNPAEQIVFQIRAEAEMDGRSSLHFKDYREGKYTITRAKAIEIMDKIEALITESIK